MVLGDKGYLSAPVQLDLFETANVTLWCPIQAEPEELDSADMGLQTLQKEI